MKTEKATFGAGCFWEPQKEFKQIKGVISTTVGYMGGTVKNPTYEMVCTDTTGHVEVVNVEFDPEIVSYEKLLDAFWSMHDPTQIDRQGVNIGKEYSSVIFYHNSKQKEAAEKSEQKLQKSMKFKDSKIATAIKPAKDFFRAEEGHQNYLDKNPVRRFLGF